MLELQFATKNLQPGTDADVGVRPSYTTTTSSAVASFTAQERNCFTCTEINLMFLPYKDNNPEHCNKHGYRYSMSNCVFEASIEVSNF